MTHIKKFTFSPLQENTYVVFDESKEAVVIDPGCLLKSEKDELAKFIDDEMLTVKALLQTHTHLDHVFGSAFVKSRFNTQMYINKLDLPILESVENQCKAFGIRGFEPVTPDIYLLNGSLFSFGNTQLEVRFVPGHSPGHVAFVNHAARYIIGGDCLFYRSIGRTDFPLCSHEQLINSIETQFFTLPDDYIVYAGHMQETTIGDEKLNNPFFK